jgi:hypothetical protein
VIGIAPDITGPNDIYRPPADQPAKPQPAVNPSIEITFPVPPRASGMPWLHNLWKPFNAIISHPIISGVIVVVLGGFVSIYFYNRWGSNLMDPSTSRSSSPSASTETLHPAQPVPAPKANVQTPEEPRPAGKKIASIAVHNGALPGQTSRASNDFELRPPAGTTQLEWRVVEPDCRGVHFSLSRDITFSWNHLDARDKGVEGNLSHGATSTAIQGDALYIGGVQGAPHPFTVEVYAR